MAATKTFVRAARSSMLEVGGPSRQTRRSSRYYCFPSTTSSPAQPLPALASRPRAPRLRRHILAALRWQLARYAADRVGPERQRRPGRIRLRTCTLFLTTGRSSRLLLADEVGFRKDAVGRARDRGALRARYSPKVTSLVLTPAGPARESIVCRARPVLRNLEASSMPPTLAARGAATCHLACRAVSGAGLRHCLSMDFAKQTAVWHSLGRRSLGHPSSSTKRTARAASPQRAAAVRALAARSTRGCCCSQPLPITGDADAFRKLLSIGSPIRPRAPPHLDPPRSSQQLEVTEAHGALASWRLPANQR